MGRPGASRRRWPVILSRKRVPRGWDTLKNGELLSAAEAAGFEVFVTTDRNIVHQQNPRGRRIAIVILSKGRWKLIRLKFADIQAAVATATPGAVVQVDI